MTLRKLLSKLIDSDTDSLEAEVVVRLFTDDSPRSYVQHVPINRVAFTLSPANEVCICIHNIDLQQAPKDYNF